jgi:hypothetical protein
MVSATVAAAACSGGAPPAPPRRVFPVAARERGGRGAPLPERAWIEPLLPGDPWKLGVHHGDQLPALV